MDPAYEDTVRAKAHEIWEREGRPEGRDREHWEKALAELGLSDDRDAAPPVTSGGAGLGLSSGLQPGGTRPGLSPGVSEGSLGTGGGSTAGADTGTKSRGRR